MKTLFEVPAPSLLFYTCPLLALDVGKPTLFIFVSLALNPGLHIKCSIDAKLQVKIQAVSQMFFFFFKSRLHIRCGVECSA